jgi:hypothetical protein
VLLFCQHHLISMVVRFLLQSWHTEHRRWMRVAPLLVWLQWCLWLTYRFASVIAWLPLNRCEKRIHFLKTEIFFLSWLHGWAPKQVGHIFSPSLLISIGAIFFHHCLDFSLKLILASIEVIVVEKSGSWRSLLWI